MKARETLCSQSMHCKRNTFFKVNALQELAAAWRSAFWTQAAELQWLFETLLLERDWRQTSTGPMT